MSEQGCTPEEDKTSGQPAQELAQNGFKPWRAALLGWRAKAALAFVFCLVLAFFLLRHETGTGESRLELGVGHNRLVHLCEPMASVSLSDPSIADLRVVSPDLMYVFAKKAGTTNIAFTAKPNPDPSNDDKERGPRPPRESTIRVHVTAGSPSGGATSLLDPKAALEVKVFGCLHKETPKPRLPPPAEVREPRLAPPVVLSEQQINIRVRFAEVSVADLKTLGIDWRTFDTGDFSFGLLADAGVTGRLDSSTPAGAPQRNGAVTILAEPNLTTVTGEAVSFLAGGEVPVLVPQGRYSVLQYKFFGVTLVFTPTLIKNNRIALHVHTEVSTISAAKKANGIDAPDFAARRGDMTAELGATQALALGGLFQKQSNQIDGDADKVRLMGDTPVIGALFRSPRFQRGETELVIFVTPYRFKPVPPDDAPRAAPVPPPPPPSAAAPVKPKAAPPHDVPTPGKNFGMIVR